MQKMSEKEAIEELKCYRACSGTQLPTEIEAAIEALKELSQYKQGGLVLIPADVYQRQCDELDAYKAIGTVDQCREAVERMKASCETCRDKVGCAIYDCFNIKCCSDWSE